MFRPMSAHDSRRGGGPEARLIELGLELPKPTVIPPGLHLPFSLINVRGDRVSISGHPQHGPDGSIVGPFGKVGADLSTDEAVVASRGIALCVLSNLRAAIGSLDRVTGWLRVFGMVNSADGYADQHTVISGFSDLIVEVFGSEVGRHSRSAVGVSGLPMNFAIEIEAEVLVSET